MIPYTVDRRPDTGVTNVTMAMWLFLSSEVMLFGSLTSAYALLRVAAPTWPDAAGVLDLRVGALHALVIAAATAAVWRARATTASPLRRRLAASALLGMLFVAVQVMEYQRLVAAGLLPAVNTFIALYFTLTGVHVLHVVGGVAANMWVLQGATSAAPLTAGRVHALSLYWLFVSLAWLAVFSLLCL